MQYSTLGKTDIYVSKLCFGTLTIGPLQRNLELQGGLAILTKAIECGVNFVDTADLYDTYPFIKEALKIKKDLVVSTKSYAYDTKTAEKSFEKAIRSIERDYIDIFMLHEQESIHTLRGHWEAVEFFLKMKERGYIRAFGISTHRVEGVKATNAIDEIQVIHPLLNLSGIGIQDGSRADMENAVYNAHHLGKGIFSMKPLGGGHLIPDKEKALQYILSLPFIDSVAIGMQSLEEVLFNTSFFSGKKADETVLESLNNKKRSILIDEWCEGCGTCISGCKSHALTIKNGKAEVDETKCVLCSYCAIRCPNFYIKIV